MANTIRAPQRGVSRQEFIVNDLSGGFVAQAASRSLDPRYLSDVQNMELVQGMWQKRKGYSFIGSFNGVGPTPRTLKGLHIYNAQGNFHLLGVYDRSLYDTYQVTKDGAGKVVTNTLPVARRYRFADFRNNVYIANGETGLMRYDGNKLKTLATPIGSLLVAYDNRLLLAGIKGDSLTIYYSDDGLPERWGALNYITLEGGTNEYITALVPVQGKLYIFTNQSIFSLVGSMENFALTKEVNGVGTISQETVTLFGNMMYFISDDRNLYEFDGGNFPKEISLPIKEYLRGKFHYTDFQNACLTYNGDGVWFTLDNSVVPSERVTLVYYPSWQAWTKFVGIPAAGYVRLQNTLLFTGCHNTGSIYQYATGYRDDATQIDAFIKTVKWSFDGVENIKRFKELYVRGALQGGGGNGFDIDFYVDDSRVASVHVTSDIPTPTEFWGGANQWGSMYWGYAADISGTRYGQAEWGSFEWGSAKPNLLPRWGVDKWINFKWGDNKKGVLSDDVGVVASKLYLSQYNIISGKSLQLVFRDNTPNHGFRLEDLTLEYIFKGVR